MEELIRDLLPHAPQHGLYVRPHIPPDKLRAAREDYAPAVAAADVVALYDATLMGSAKDGALFTRDRVVFQNNDLEPAQTVRYEDLVHLESKKKLLGGRKLFLDVNRGRATITLTLDFSGKPRAAEFVARFLQEALLHGVRLGSDARRAGATDVAAVREALDALHADGRLSDDDRRRLLAVLDARG